MGAFSGWLSRLDSNQDSEDQNLVCGHYTTGQRNGAYYTITDSVRLYRISAAAEIWLRRRGNRRHLPSKHLNHRAPTALPSRTPSARTDRLPHLRTPMVEWFVTLAVGESRDDAVITFLASPVLIAGCIFVVRSIAKSLEYLVLTTKCPVQSLTSHVRSKAKGYESSASEFWVVGSGKCTVWHSHFDVLSFEIPRMCTWAPVRRKHEGSGHLMSNQSSTGAGSAINSFRSSSLSSYFQGEHG